MYPYESLNPEGRNIRLISLHPVKHDEMITCQIETASLDDLPGYSALSYVWGDAADTRPIILNGHSHGITVNLESALRNLGRKASKPRKLWVDALCINQHDISERSQQVNLMNAIYKQSYKTIAWLGECKLETFDCKASMQLTMALLEDLASNKHLHQIPLLWEPDDSYSESRYQICCIMGFLMSRPYWNRAWIVQEFILPNEAEIVTGSFSIGRDIFIRAAGMHTRHLDKCCSPPPSQSGGLLGIHYLLGTLSEKLRPLNILLLHGHKAEIQATNLWNLLSMFRTSEASDHRDKIFAFLGLGREWPTEQLFLPDYNLTAYDLYMNVAVRMLNDSQSLLLLTQCTKKASYPQLPSWVPDWTASESCDPLFMKWCPVVKHLFSAPGLIPRHALIPDNRLLMLRAIKIDTIKTVTPPDASAPGRTMALWEKIGRSSLLVHGYTAEEISTNRKWRQQLMRTALGDQILPFSTRPPGYRRSRDEDLDVVDEILAQAKAVVDIFRLSREHPNILYRELWNSIMLKQERGEKLLILDQYFFGLGPPSAREGDEIWIMPSSPVPIVLRPLETSASDGGEPSRLHQLVGHCYVDGVMDGEAAENHEEKLETVRIA